MHAYRIHPLAAADIPAVTGVYAQVLEAAYISFSELAEGKAEGFGILSPRAAAIFQSQLTALWQDADHGFFVATVGEDVVGFALASLHETEAGHKECWLDDIAVKTVWQRQGIATALTKQVFDWGAEKQCKYYLLESGILNHHAHHIFEKLGFQSLSTVYWRPWA